MSSRVLITGAAGFIGRWVVAELRRFGNTVFTLDIKDLPEGVSAERHIRCDILDRGALAAAVDAVVPAAIIHLAARTDLDDSATLGEYAANTEGVRNLVEVVRAADSVNRVIYTSSQLVCRPGYVPEHARDYRPHTVYGRSKAAGEEIVRAENGGGKTWCIVRPTTAWGPFMSEHYRSMLRMIERGRYFHCGTDGLRKSYGYVGNMAFQYRRLLEVNAGSVHGKTLYLADYEPIGLRWYGDALSRELGAPAVRSLPLWLARLLGLIGDVPTTLGWRSFPFNSFRLRNILTEYVFDMSETERICGPLPFSHSDGVRATASWHRSGTSSWPQ